MDRIGKTYCPERLAAMPVVDIANPMDWWYELTGLEWLTHEECECWPCRAHSQQHFSHHSPVAIFPQ